MASNNSPTVEAFHNTPIFLTIFLNKQTRNRVMAGEWVLLPVPPYKPRGKEEKRN